MRVLSCHYFVVPQASNRFPANQRRCVVVVVVLEKYSTRSDALDFRVDPRSRIPVGLPRQPKRAQHLH